MSGERKPIGSILPVAQTLRTKAQQSFIASGLPADDTVPGSLT